MIDRSKLRAEAIALRKLLRRYARRERDAALCLRELNPLLFKATWWLVREPVKSVPCGWYFHEGSLRQYPELEEAYSKFAVRAQGTDMKKLSEFIAQIRQE